MFKWSEDKLVGQVLVIYQWQYKTSLYLGSPPRIWLWLMSCDEVSLLLKSFSQNISSKKLQDGNSQRYWNPSPLCGLKLILQFLNQLEFLNQSHSCSVQLLKESRPPSSHQGDSGDVSVFWESENWKIIKVGKVLVFLREEGYLMFRK